MKNLNVNASDLIEGLKSTIAEAGEDVGVWVRAIDMGDSVTSFVSLIDGKAVLTIPIPKI